MSPSIINNERELLSRIASGEEAAFTELFERYRGTIYTYLIYVTKSREVSEDIMGDIFMKLWNGKEILGGVENLEGFLRTVAHNKALDFFRKTARNEKLKKAYSSLASTEEKGPEELLLERELKHILLEAVNQLPPQRRIIYSMSRHQGMTHEEIAVVLGLSRNTVKNSIMAASQSISEFLQKKYGNNAALCWIFLLAKF